MWHDTPKDRETQERWRRYPAVERGSVGGGHFALTFDDGPDINATPAVLDALDGEGIKATFFMVGEQVSDWPHIAAEVVRRGHEVACHGYLHLGHPERSDDVTEDMRLASGTIEATTGVPPRLFRPPYGRFSDSSYRSCEKLNWKRIYWSSWGEDWDSEDAQRIADTVLGDLRDGSIVLLHDSPRYASRGSARATADSIPLVVDAARGMGLKAVTVSELLDLDS